MAVGRKTGGRVKGTPNKTTAEIKEAIELAFNKLGGVEALVEWGRKKPDLFYTQLLPKLLPLQVNAKHSGELTHTIEIIREIVKKPDEA